MLMRSVRALVLVICCIAAGSASALIDYSNRYRSPRNPERAIRSATTLIILHTTEAPARSSLNKLSERGEAHYCIPENGTVYRIIDRDREAYHAGRSMWNGKSNVDEFSIGIEVVGHHDQPVTLKQLSAIRELLAELQALYKIDDAHVLCHGHIAYAAPNKWQKRSCRGRKRCGMLFAMQSVRTKLDLKTRPSYDPDIRAKRLVQADDYLHKVLYGGVDTMTGSYGRGTTVKGVAPGANSVKDVKEKGTLAKIGGILGGFGKKDASRTAADSSATREKRHSAASSAPASGGSRSTTAATAKPASGGPTPVSAAPGRASRSATAAATPAAVHDDDKPEKFYTVGIDGWKLEDFAGEEAFTDRVIAVFTDGSWKLGSKMKSAKGKKLPYGTKVMVGYTAGGPVTRQKNALSICGGRWHSPDTFYLIQRALIPGNKIDEKRISVGTMIFYRQ